MLELAPDRQPLEEEPQPVRLLPGRVGEPGRVVVQQLRLQQPLPLEPDLADQAGRLLAQQAAVEQRRIDVVVACRGGELGEQCPLVGQQPAGALLPDHEALDLGEQGRRGDHRQRLPVDPAPDRVLQRLDPPPHLGAGLQEAGESVLRHDLLDPLPAHARTAAVDPGRHQQLDQRGAAGGLVERGRPVRHPGERIALAVRVEEHQPDRDVAQREPVEQPVTGLAGEVPEQDLPGLLGRAGPLVRPDLPAVGGATSAGSSDR